MGETMKRLTRRTTDGKVAYALLQAGECVDPIDLLRVWGDRLAAYEDTGLEPEEITEMKRAWNAACGAYEFNRVEGK